MIGSKQCALFFIMTLCLCMSLYLSSCLVKNVKSLTRDYSMLLACNPGLTVIICTSFSVCFSPFTKGFIIKKLPTVDEIAALPSFVLT